MSQLLHYELKYTADLFFFQKNELIFIKCKDLKYSINGYITLRSLIYKTYHFYVVPQIYLDGITFFAC